MFTLTVNGKCVETQKDQKLLTFLRDDLRLTSVKDGCSEGACGACMVLIDGKKVKACIPKVSTLTGKSIVTLEGLSERERAVYVHCFAEAGAVQCGYCIPGMVISAKSLLDNNLNPNRDQVKQAIKGNLCRCTGYVKIEEAILNAAHYFRDNLPIPPRERQASLNIRFKRVDAEEKILGTGEFVDDIIVPGMIYAKALRSKYPRAVINRIDISKALAHLDCVRILTEKDVPNKKVGHLVMDWDVMIPEGGTTRYIGDALALVATNHKETLDEVLSLIEVDYTELTPVTCPTDALKAEAPLIHEQGNILRKEVLRRGNVDEALKNAKYVVTRKYRTPFT
ncbi:MAG TPA: selenium-dependent xanthine dehydrogenase, partial [Firmicutes bacterium]|nr:selenium-dependent xanthine dehydrogenase [Bacillota bacterium]